MSETATSGPKYTTGIDFEFGPSSNTYTVAKLSSSAESSIK